jgi:hypothetical protein
MASGTEFHAGATGDERYAYDYTYLPPLAFVKSALLWGFRCNGRCWSASWRYESWST